MAERAKHVLCKPDSLSSVPETTSESWVQLVSIYGERDRKTIWTLRSQLVCSTHNRQERMPCLHRLEGENQLPEMSSGFYTLKHIREERG